MALSESARRRLHELLSAHCEGRLDAAQADILSQLLRDPDAQQYYIDFAMLEACLDLASIGFPEALEPSQLDRSPAQAPASPFQPSRPGSPVHGFLQRTLHVGGDFRLRSFAGVAGLAGMFLILSLTIILPAYLSLRQAQRENAQRALQDEQERQLAVSKAQEEKIAESKTKQASRALFDVYAKLLSERNPLYAARAVGDSAAWVYAHGLAQARLTFAVDCRWRGAAPDVGEALTRGRRLELKAGLAEIVFQNGARTILQGPATLQVISGSGAYLTLGRYTVNVEDPRAKGFEVDAPGMKYTDLGTEFGVFVSPDGEQEMHVFRGTVEAEQAEVRDQRSEVGDQKPGDLRRPTSDFRPLTSPILPPAPRPLVLSAHEAIRVAAPPEQGKPATPIEAIAADEKQFVRSQQLSEMLGQRSSEFHRWKKFSLELCKRPDLVAYYDFEPDESDRTVLHNRAATGPEYDGKLIRGAAWCKGQLPGKSAIRFDEPRAAVQISIPGELPEMTLVASLLYGDSPKSGALLNSSELTTGYFNWMIHDNGRILLHCFSHDTISHASKPTYDADRAGWHQVATTYDSASGRIAHYFDGTFLDDAVLPAGIPAKIGNNATIGNYEHEDRPLRTGVGELLVFRKALSREAIEQLYKSEK